MNASGNSGAARDPLGFLSGSLLSSSTGQLLAATNRNGQVTTYQYYPPGGPNAGLLYCETGPTGKRTFYNYNSRGEQTHVWGDVPYPEKREFNAFGDLVSLSTYRGGTLWAGTNWPASPGVSADVTTWAYDEPTGLLTNKTDAAGRSVNFDYYVTREPMSKTWARGDSSTNTFSPNGDLGQVDYFGALNYPVITTNYNRFGLPRLVVDNSGSHELSYDYAGRVIEDICTAGLLAGTTIKYRRHPLHGKDQVIVETVWGSVTNSVTNIFGFDSNGRVAGVTNGTRNAAYTYLANSDVLSATTSRHSGSVVLTASRAWDYGYRLRSVNNVLTGAGAVSQHTYAYDALDRRRHATLADGSAWDYTYNDRDEVTRAARSWIDHSPVAGQQFEFAYDPIGNRTVAREGGDANGLNLRPEGYGANNLNQYTVRTNSNANEVIGAAYATAAVTVNGASPARKGEYFDYALSGGGGSAAWQSVTNVATLSTNSATEIGGRVLPPLTQAFYYDADGNLTNDSVWTYHWDPENRLVSMVMTNAASIPNAQRCKLDFEYDHQGRRAIKIVSTWNGSAFTNPQTNRFVYDNWNLMAELDGTNGLIRTYTWGLDLTGSLETAGGIGGLVMMVEHTNSAAAHFPAYDGNGNVMALVKTDGTITARYEYGPFGESLRVTGSSAEANPFRWSTKFTDEESGISYYGYRYSSANLGRWLNRDPIEETGGLNIYGFAENIPIGRFDPLGTWTLPEIGAAGGGTVSLQSAAWGGFNLYMRVQSAVGAFNYAQQVISMMDDGLDADELAQLIQDAGKMLEERAIGKQATKLAKQYRKWRIQKQGEGKHTDVGGHHVQQKAAHNGNVNYSQSDGFSISQKYMKDRGWNHSDMTRRQRQLQNELAASGRANTFEEQTRIAYEALRAGGASPQEAKRLVMHSLTDLAAQGVKYPTRIPWN